MNVIETNKLEKIYNPKGIPVNALRGIDIEIKKGEFTTIVGPSGSGKTTLLNILGGLDSPTNGNVIVNGVDLSQLSDNKLIDFRKDNIDSYFRLIT
ncbi:MAG: ATP-binding cassette domain-containing protein [Saprospiraceae bacterium]